MIDSRRVATAFAGVGVVVLSCSADREPISSQGSDAGASKASAEAFAESPAAATRITELRARFRLAVRAPDEGLAALAQGVRATAAVPTPRAGEKEKLAVQEDEPAEGAQLTERLIMRT
jgi:hypothetical protein